MAKRSDYDSDVQMFVQRPRDVDLAHLRFLRWLAVRGWLEHEPVGRSHGVYARAEVALAQTDSVQPGTGRTRHVVRSTGVDSATEEHLQ